MLLAAYALLLTESVGVGWILTAAAIRVAPRWGYLYHPGHRKIHAAPKPVLGGLAVYITFVGVLAVNMLLAARLDWTALLGPAAFPVPPANVVFVRKELLAVLSGSFIVFILGLVDDRRSLPASLKLLVQVASTIPLLMAGVRVHGFLPPVLGAIMTVLWVVFVTNAFNFLDNMDGLCSGVATICLLVLAAVAFLGGEWFMTAIYVVLAGALLGFLRHNWFPSRIFLGDGGALSVGYLVASLSILSTYYTGATPTGLPILIPVIVLGVPIFDSLSVYAIRLRQGRPLWVGDNSHFSHRLLSLGMSQKQAVSFIYLVTLSVSLSALGLRRLPWREASIQTAQIALFFCIIAFLEGVAAAQNHRLRPPLPKEDSKGGRKNLGP